MAGSVNRYSNLFTEIRQCKPSVIMEIGTWNAVHAQQMINEAMKHRKTVCYYGFDLFEDMTPDVKKKEIHAKKNVTKAEAQKRLVATKADWQLIVGNTHNTLPDFVKRNIKADFVFIDGGHSVETIANDWEYVSRMLNDNAVVIFDDYYEGDLTKGCKSLIDKIISGVLYPGFKAEKLNPVDIAKPASGELHIRFAKVTKC